MLRAAEQGCLILPGLSLPAAACLLPLTVFSCYLWLARFLPCSTSCSPSPLLVPRASISPCRFFLFAMYLQPGSDNAPLHSTFTPLRRPRWQGQECIPATELQWARSGQTCASRATGPRLRCAAATAAPLPLQPLEHLVDRGGGRAGRLRQGLRCTGDCGSGRCRGRLLVLLLVLHGGELAHGGCRGCCLASGAAFAGWPADVKLPVPHRSSHGLLLLLLLLLQLLLLLWHVCGRHRHSWPLLCHARDRLHSGCHCFCR